MRAGIVPCSDMAGEVVAAGADAAAQWGTGDRVAANFTLGHVHGDLTPALAATALGGGIDGVLSEYRVFPAEVGRCLALCHDAERALVAGSHPGAPVV